jgi:hypothetical protein
MIRYFGAAGRALAACAEQNAAKIGYATKGTGLKTGHYANRIRDLARAATRDWPT